MDEMRAEYESMKLVPKVTLHEMWYNPILRQPLIIAMVVMLSQQLSGINAAIFFSTKIFKDAGLDETGSAWATIGVSITNLMMTLISLVLIEKAGRRTLHLTGLAGMAITTVTLALCLNLQADVPVLKYISIISVFVFVIMFATGPGSIPWFLVSELFGVGARGLATSIAVAVNWSANFMVGLTFLPLTNTLGNSTFLVFTVFLAIFWIYTYKNVPETKGRSPDEIAAAFRQKSYQ
jgi:SP family facilitated glucose transporter-like MFS transporter 1